jgi:O-glycosyl hydrolase
LKKSKPDCEREVPVEWNPHDKADSRRKTIWMRPSFLCLLCAAFWATGTAFCQQLNVTLDGNSRGRTFDGIGAVSAGASSRLLIDYPEPQRSQILDYLFKPGYGAALQHLKVEIGADVDSTDGSEPSAMRTPSDRDDSRGYEWWLMSEAQKRNPGIVLEVLPWGAPGWVGNDTLYTAKMAEYVADFIKMAQTGHHLSIAYTGIWNEKVYDANYVKELHRKLEANHLSTKIVCCDEYSGEGAGQWAIADAILKDPSLATTVAVIGVHYPRVNGHITTTESARRTGKPLWSTEDQPNEGGGPFVSREWAIGGRILAHLYNQNYLEGSLSATEIWSPITSYYDILAAPNSGLMYGNTPWSGYYEVQGTIWATAHTTQFAQPGWQYLDSSSGSLRGKGSYVALRSPDRKNWSVVLETIDARNPQTVTFHLAGGLAVSAVSIWETNSIHTFEHVATIRPVQDAFTYAFDPDSLYSLTTTTGQGRGTAQPPPPSPFPFAYEGGFEHTPLHRSPKYLSDQDGAFEVLPCSGRPGRCLEQVITDKPIPWGPLPDPFTLAGDATWTDYSVAADVHFQSSASATIMGRIDSADVFQDGSAHWPSGYVLRLEPGGCWRLLSSRFKMPVATLASGTTALEMAQWHQVELRFEGDTIGAYLDGRQLASVRDTSHSHGMIALGTEWNHTQFDNLRVAPGANPAR